MLLSLLSNATTPHPLILGVNVNDCARLSALKLQSLLGYQTDMRN